MRARTLLLLALALLLLACDRAPPEPTPAERARAAREAAAKRKAERVDRLLRRAGLLAKEDEVEDAWAAWREARDLTGETPDLARTAAEIRAAEGRVAHQGAYEEILALLAEKATPELLARLRDRATGFLEDWPESPHKKEVEEALEYARSELGVSEAYDRELNEARDHLAAGRCVECVKACNRALAVFERDEARELRRKAYRALTPEGMVFIPGGFFLAGKGRERTYLAPFYIEKTEVTNAAYAAFVKATGRKPPKHFGLNGAVPPGKEEMPVTYVTLDDALAYAAWAKRRLPTEIEWERAARGTDGRAYPWGDEWDAAKGHFGTGGTVAVGSKPFDRSPDGVMDMGGNVMEFTLPVKAPEDGDAGAVIKGGHWSDDFHPEYALTFAVWPVKRTHQDSGTGFRCVKSVVK